MFPRQTKSSGISSLQLIRILLICVLLLHDLVACTAEHDSSNPDSKENDDAEMGNTTESSAHKKYSRAPQENSEGPSTVHKCTENCVPQDLMNELRPRCPEIYENIVVAKGFIPYNTSVGEFRLVKEISTLEECARKCCSINGCTAVEMIDTSCFLIFCNKGPEACLPHPISNEVAPFSYTALKIVYLRVPLAVTRKGTNCEVGIDTLCWPNEVCKPTNRRSRNGHCECDELYIRTDQDECVQIPGSDVGEASLAEESSEALTSPAPSPNLAAPATSPVALKTLQVSVGSKNITLPVNEATLYAYAVPEEAPDNLYSYTWSLVSHPASDPAQIEGQATNTLKLSKLIQGTYMFQVAVTSSKGNMNGTANATVYVIPEKRVNLAPVAKISPAEQSVQLPTSSAVLDAGSSTDDDKIISYKWELLARPIEYVFDQTKLSINSSTLQVKDLIPGHYVFKVTVEDTNHITNSTTANITVLASIDYPPTANAGNDVVIFLPQNEVVLNGNASSDDKKIVQWEWKAIGENNAVDIQDTHTPYLKLSQLQEGIYQFELRVTDEAGQQSNPSTVHVFVKPPTGNPPTADAGKSQTIALPQNWVILDASESKADSKVVKWNWTQLSGPNNATILNPEDMKTNVTNLTKGDYEFQVQVENDVKLSATAKVTVTVAQKVNDPPKANAGEDVSITLPVNLVELNGGGSTDDVKVTSWEWTREPDSAVAGVILGKSDTTAHLQLTDLIPGKYVLKLTVKDEQGLTDSDTVNLTVKEDPMVENLIEIIIGVPLTSWTETDKEKFFQQIMLLLRDSKPVFHHITSQVHTGYVVVTLYGKEESGQVTPALSVVAELRNRLHQDSGIFGFPVLSVDTVLCLDNCSGHGKCQDLSIQRVCMCDAFWMENYFKRNYGNGERNCEWSKIYVVVIACFLLVMLYALVWSLLFFCHRSRRGVLKDTIVGSGGGRLTFSSPRNNGRRHNHSNKKQYTLLEPEEIDLEVTGVDLESEDSDSDVSLVEVKRTNKGNSVVVKNSATLSESGPRRGILSNNGIKRNGILKQPRPNVKA